MVAVPIKMMKMKKYLFILLLLLGAICPTATALSDTQHSANVSVDSRIELLAVVQFLSGYGERYGLITRYDFPYKRDVEEYFSPYRNHPAVKFFAKMSATGFSYDAPPAAMLYLSDPPDLTLQLPFTDYLKKRAWGGRRLERFVSLLRDFAHDTHFMAFFEKHEGTYQQVVADARKKMEGADSIGTLENYYGMKQHSYNIILVPLFRGGFGPRIEREDNTYDIYNIFGPASVNNGIPVFRTVEGFKHLAWHEFSHSFVNPITERFGKQIAKYSSLYHPISDKMKEQAYGSWQASVNEHIVRAVTARLAYRESGKKAGEQALRKEKSKGFFYVETLYKRLEEYENQREKYPTFEDFFPELVNVLKELHRRKLGDDFYSVPFTGTIRGAILGDEKNLILIVPTNENDKDVQKKIHVYVREVRKKLFRGLPILTDKQALRIDLSGKAVIAYGTLTGNLWVAEHLAELPVRIEPNQIVADSVYTGTHLRFITAWPNLQNPRKGVVVYTAQQPEDIIGIHSVVHGGTDYLVAKGKEVLKAANYKKQNGQWTFK